LPIEGFGLILHRKFEANFLLRPKWECQPQVHHSGLHSDHVGILRLPDPRCWSPLPRRPYTSSHNERSHLFQMNLRPIFGYGVRE